MDDDAVSLVQHSRKERAIEPNGGEKVGVYGLLPIVIAESERAAAGCAGAADIVDEDVQAAETILYVPDDPARALGPADVRLNEEHPGCAFHCRRACSGGDLRAARSKPSHDGRAHAFSAAGDKR